MKKALVKRNRGRGRSSRILELRAPGEEFPVAPELEWVDVPDDTDPQRQELEDGARRKTIPQPAPPMEESLLDKLIATLRAKGVLGPTEP